MNSISKNALTSFEKLFIIQGLIKEEASYHMLLVIHCDLISEGLKYELIKDEQKCVTVMLMFFKRNQQYIEMFEWYKLYTSIFSDYLYFTNCATKI
ncbi:hypothetical protein V1477_002793 [Vespula maculifrons]|uniref:Uncharacterized protein n=1 Tax=Vespula maculifrons TaxID=7453 RepID=A0ABD2CVL3_VESMC